MTLFESQFLKNGDYRRHRKQLDTNILSRTEEYIHWPENIAKKCISQKTALFLT